MPTFALRSIEALPDDSPVRVVALLRGERDDFAKFEQEVRKNGGTKELMELKTYMSRVAEDLPVPHEKFKQLRDVGQDRFGEFEFKHKRLRVYACRTADGKLVVCSGYQAVKTTRGTSRKTNQGPAIERFRTLIKQLPDDLNSLPYE